MDTLDIVVAVVVGLGATFFLDLWNMFLRRAFNIRSLNPCLLGRWLCHMPAGTFRHVNIAAATEKPRECMVGWMAHYTIGATLALAFVVIAPGDWLARPTVLTALVYGIGTVIFPLFIMQPSLGLGIASSKTPNPTQARLKSLMTHTVFGVGLWLSALGLNHVLRLFAWR